VVTKGFVFDTGYGRLLLRSALVGVLTGVSVLVFFAAEYLLHELVWSGQEVPSGWFSGSLYAVAIVMVAGALVGYLRGRFQMTGPDPNFIDELIEGEVDPRHSVRIASIGLTSLVGGASVGPEASLGSLGAGIGTSVAERRGGDEEEKADLTFAGISAVFGGLGTFAYVGPIMAMEIYHPRWSSGFKRIAPGLIAAVAAFLVLFPALGTPFLAVYQLPAPELRLWWIPLALLLGLVGAALGILIAVVIGVSTRLAARVSSPLARALIGAAVIAALGYALPLTMFSGRQELDVILNHGASLGVGLLAMVLVGKILAFAISMRWGFFGGPFFPLLFIGAVLGTLLAEIIPGLPAVVAVSSLAAGACASLIPLPLMVIILTSMIFGLPLEMTVLPSIATVMAYLAVHGTGLLEWLKQVKDR